MAKKKETDADVETIKGALESQKAVIGTEETIKNLRANKLSAVYLSQNCSLDVKETIERYADMGSCTVTQLSYPNEELGVLCKKPFSISVIGILN